MATKPKLSLPYTLTGSKITMEFDVADPLGGVGAGVVPTQVTEVASGVSIELHDPISVFANNAQSLWWLKGKEYLEDGTILDVEARPGIGTFSAEFDSYGPFTDGAATWVEFEWRNVQIGSARVWVRIVARLDDSVNDDSIQWFGYVGRQNVSRVHLTTFVYPLMLIKGFSTLRAGDTTHAEANGRTRFIKANAFNAIAGFDQNSNTSFSAFPFTTPVQEIMPNLVKMPFLCWCSGNDQGSEYRLNFSIRARRSQPSVMELWWQWLRNGNDAYMMGGVGHRVPEARLFANEEVGEGEFEEMLPASSFENTFAPLDPILTEVFFSLTDHFWYDICERHRRDYELAALPVRVRDDDRKTSYGKKPNLFLAMWADTIDPDEEARSMERYNEYSRILELAYNNPYVSTRGGIAHQQSHQVGFAGDVGGQNVEEQFIRPMREYYAGMKEALEAMKIRGWNPSLYLIPAPIPAIAEWSDPLVQASQSFFNLPFNSEVQFSGSDPLLFIEWLNKVVMQAIGDFGFRGFLHDTYTGLTRQHIRLDPRDTKTPRTWVHGGGPGEPMRRRLNLQGSRERVRNLGVEISLITENAEEFQAPNYDVAGPGYFYLPNHLDEEAMTLVPGTAIPFMAPDAVKTDYPSPFRQLNPDLYRIVHNAYEQHFQFAVDLMQDPLDTFQKQLHGPAAQGLTGDEYVLAQCYYRARALSNGTVIQMHTVYLDDANYNPLLVFDKLEDQLVNADPAIDTTDAGSTIVDFHRDLFEVGAVNYGGPWMMDGTLERPLEEDMASPLIQTVNNPAAPYKKLLAFQGLATPGRYDNYPFYSTVQREVRFGNEDFDVPAVMVSVWSTAEPRLLVMVINWTDAPADYQGNFNPGAYPVLTAKAFDVRELSKDGSFTTVLSSHTGNCLFRSNAVSGPDVYMGHLPARTIKLYEVVPLP